MAASVRLPELMPHLILLGDSIFDNGSYTGSGPDVITQVRHHLPAGWKATLLARDGATTDNIPFQLAGLPLDATHLVLSIGGNDALRQSALLDMPVRSTAQAFSILADAVQEFDTRYKKAINACLKAKMPLIICTIYNGNFPDPDFQQRAATALASFNDVVIQTAVEHQLQVIELRQIINQPEDYANPIEPSSKGGEKLSTVIIQLVSAPRSSAGGAQIIGAGLHGYVG